jgi:hypothetical protein
MKRALKAIMYFLGYCLYFLFTMKARDRYFMGKEKGMRCIDSYDSSNFIYGSSTTYVFDKTKMPVREYTTWREFWQIRGYGRESRHVCTFDPKNVSKLHMDPKCVKCGKLLSMCNSENNQQS